MCVIFCRKFSSINGTPGHLTSRLTSTRGGGSCLEGGVGWLKLDFEGVKTPKVNGRQWPPLFCWGRVRHGGSIFLGGGIVKLDYL